MDPQRGNVNKTILIQMTLLILSMYVSHDSMIVEREYKNIAVYGCPECHTNSLSCHVDWQRQKIGQIMELWNKSFHVTLMKDTFNSCSSFFRKGNCRECHPGLLKPVTVDYKKIYGDSWQ